MGAVDAVKFLKSDHGDVGSGFRDAFAKDRPYMSLLQRNKKMLKELLDMFDWKDDADLWVKEYKKSESKSEGSDTDKLVRYKRRTYFCLCGWRELNEDFGRGDVSCLRDLRTPLVTSRTPLKEMEAEFNDQ